MLIARRRIDEEHVHPLLWDDFDWLAAEAVKRWDKLLERTEAIRDWEFTPKSLLPTAESSHKTSIAMACGASTLHRGDGEGAGNRAACRFQGTNEGLDALDSSGPSSLARSEQGLWSGPGWDRTSDRGIMSPLL